MTRQQTQVTSAAAQEGQDQDHAEAVRWLHIHWEAILLPARTAEHVVVHEIAHLNKPPSRVQAAWSVPCQITPSARPDWPGTVLMLKGPEQGRRARAAQTNQAVQ